MSSIFFWAFLNIVGNFVHVFMTKSILPGLLRQRVCFSGCVDGVSLCFEELYL